MASNYPGSLDSLTNPTANDTLNSATVPHADQHANANDAIEAIEATLGINPQGSSATVVARLNTLDGTVSGKVASVGSGSTAITIGGTATAPTVAVASGSTSTVGVVQLTDSTSSTSTTTAATPNSVKSAYDLANTANTSAGTVSTNLTTHTSATTAHGSTALNTASAIVQRDASGNFSAGTITATLSGNASTATTATTAGNLSGTQTANFVYAAPNGSSGTGSFRALVSADIPASLANTTSVNGTSIPASATLLTSTSTVGIAQGGTGSTYGATFVGQGVLLNTFTKATNNTTPEAIFRDYAGTIDYFNVDANTTYRFDGFIHLAKSATGSNALPNMSLIYVQTGSTSTLLEQSAVIRAHVQIGSSAIGVITGAATNTTFASNGTGSTAATTYYLYFRGFITTNATTAGRINIGVAQTVAGSTVGPDVASGTYINIAKLGTGNAALFGNWT